MRQMMGVTASFPFSWSWIGHASVPALFLSALVLTACDGTLSGEGPIGAAPGGVGRGNDTLPTNGGVASGESGGPLDCSAGAPLQVGLTRLRRLTRTEFNNTVRDLLGLEGDPASAISPDERVGPFDSNATAPITDLLVEQHGEVASALASAALARRAEISPCDLSADATGACALEFIERFGLKAYRRPLETEEVERYLGLFRLGREQSPEHAFQLVLEAMLQSPFFLYHADVGVQGTPSAAPAELTSFELASRLSYFLWDTMPDDSLFALAESGALRDPVELEAQVRRMLDDPRALNAIPTFHLQWLGVRDMEGVAKDPQQFPQFGLDMADALIRETARFSDEVIRRGDGLMSTLFTADFSLLDGPLFDLYGVARPAGFTAGQRVPLNPAERSGILTQGAFLATHAHWDQTSPVHRGLFVRENILCQTIPPPPPNVIPTPPAPTPGTTTRERISAHQSEASCSGCHKMMDQIGLGFETYDATGAFRSEEDNRPVDASGNLIETGDPALDGPFNGAIELSQKLAGSPVVQECLTRQWFRFALGRSLAKDDECSLARMKEQFVRSGGNVRELLVSIALSGAFRNVRSMGASAGQE
jgi:Protein of unknown function (DUF1592)/Protein of unknown function (DUF1588)/Protein of unknown function (DUF1595)/Protein of unknown function (DUF1585)/Protein of unknown function (DUF1587)